MTVKKKRILVIEDDKEIRKVLTEFLLQNHYEDYLLGYAEEMLK